MQPGEIYRHEHFYLDRDSGGFKPRCFVVLALTLAGDVIARLLTDRFHSRPEIPRFYCGDPYPSFYLGVLGNPVAAKCWVDLRGLDDFDRIELAARERKNQIKQVGGVDKAIFTELLQCVSDAEDTTRLQAKRIRESLAAMNR